MAHHTRTPASVLDAPSRLVAQTNVPTGATRQERRHGVSIVGMDKDTAAAYLRSLNGTNTPHVRTTARRGKKVRRQAIAVEQPATVHARTSRISSALRRLTGGSR